MVINGNKSQTVSWVLKTQVLENNKQILLIQFEISSVVIYNSFQ